MTEPLNLDPIAAREAAATPGPWWTDDGLVRANTSRRQLAELYTFSPYHRPEADAAFIAHARQDVPALLDEVRRLRAELADSRAARRTASDSADRFRDVLSEALGHPADNPGDDTLIAELRQHFGKTGPEPTRWRSFVAHADEIRTAQPAPASCPAD